MRRDCDLLVLGSGAAGLSAALTGARLGLRVVLAEKAEVLGGTSAWSGSWIWCPGNALAAEAGVRSGRILPFDGRKDWNDVAQARRRAALGTPGAASPTPSSDQQGEARA